MPGFEGLKQQNVMNMIPTRTHGFLDYGSALLIAASPWLFGFSGYSAPTWPLVAAGMLILGLSLFTDYEMGLVKMVSMTTHLRMDILLGVLLAVSPWLLEFADTIFWPHVAFGALEIGAGLLTQKQPAYTHPTNPAR
jgi:hypothetical protein